MKKIILKTTVAFSLIMYTYLINAATDPAQKGYSIAVAIDNRDSGFHDNSVELDMILKNGKGDETLRKLKVKVLEEGDKSLIRFTFPADLKGTALLTYPHQTRSDDQWLYLPTANRTKRISSRNQSGAFMGSEFSFEDMTKKDVEDYSYKFIKIEPCRESDNIKQFSQCDVIERFPKDKHSGYSKQKLWIEQIDKKIYKIEYYDRKNSLLKVFTASIFKLYNDKYWRPSRAEMHNVQTEKRTVLEYKNFEFSLGLSKREFHRRALAE